MLRALFMLAFACSASTCSASASSWLSPDAWPPRFAACEPYRAAIEDAVADYWALYPYPAAWAAQVYQESRCDATAVSPVGAAGLAQFMPRTWRETTLALHIPPGTSPHDKIAIKLGAYYMAKQMAIWSAKRPLHEKHLLGAASYNAGAGNVLRAQKLCAGALMWNQIRPCLDEVTGRHAHETATYIERILRWWKELRGCGFGEAPPEIQEAFGCPRF